MFDIDKKAFGYFISELRKEKGYTQKELAQKLYVSEKQISGQNILLFLILALVLGIWFYPGIPSY